MSTREFTASPFEAVIDMVRRRKLERFIETVEGLPELYTEFDAGQWAALVDSMTVHAKDRITFTLTCVMEIEE